MVRKKKRSPEDDSWSMGRDGEENPEEGYESPVMGRNSGDSDDEEEYISEDPEEVGAVLAGAGRGTAASPVVVGGDDSDEEEEVGEERKDIPEVVGGIADDNDQVVDKESVLEGLRTYRKEKVATPDESLKFQLLNEKYPSKASWNGGDGSKRGDFGGGCIGGTLQKEYSSDGKVEGSSVENGKVSIQQEKEKHGKHWQSRF